MFLNPAHFLHLQIRDTIEDMRPYAVSAFKSNAAANAYKPKHIISLTKVIGFFSWLLIWLKNWKLLQRETYRLDATGYMATLSLSQFLDTNCIFFYPTFVVYINYTSIDIESQIAESQKNR